jgi:hypothetical protein
MSKRIPTGITRDYLESVALPNHGGRYTPISHKSIIDKVHAELAARGFNVEAELYRASVHGNVANGMYILDQGTDPDMKMMFVWGNSYDKSMRFKCGVGVYIPKTGNYIFHGNVANYARKHTGTADQDALEMIQTHLNKANAHYTELLDAKDKLINSSVSVRQASELVGRMFIEEQCINKEQASSVRDRIINEVELFDNLAWNNGWNFYNSVATAIRMSHPKSWFEDQSKMHKLILEEVIDTNTDVIATDLPEVTTPEPTNQLDIFAVIEEVENTEVVVEFEEKPEIKLNSPTDVIVDEIPEELFIFDEPKTTTFDLPDL